MEHQFIKGGYHITTDPTFQNELYGITPELAERMERLAAECFENSTPKLIEKLHQLILKHPTVPQLKNYKATAYQLQGKQAKSLETNEWASREHPDYLFAKLNTANHFIEIGEPDKVPELLGENLELQSLYPEREIFHLGEFTSYYKIAIRYFVSIENWELAENRFSLLSEVAPDHPDTEQAETFLWPLHLKMTAMRIEEDAKNRIETLPLKTAPEIVSEEAPNFHHPEIQYLYEYDMAIAHDTLRDILALPHQTLIEDLEKILIDAVDRYGYFKAADVAEEFLSFPLHALFLLKELRAQSSLPKILSFLEYDSDFLAFWLGDHQTDSLWECIYVLSTDLNSLKEFMLKPGVDTYSKAAVSEAVKHQLLYHPEKKEAVLGIYTDVLNHFANAHEDDNLIDSDFIGLLIGDILDCKLSELKPMIKRLFEKDYVALEINGDYDDVVKHFEIEKPWSGKHELKNIFDHYTYVVKNWASYTEDEDAYDRDDAPYIPSYQQPAISEKVGRNEPCPCGSGKKYKKCCLA